MAIFSGRRFAWLLLLAGVPSAVWPQAPGPAVRASPVVIAEIAAAIDERYAEIEKDAALDAATRAAALSRLTEGRAFLAQAQADIDKTQQIARERAAAPELRVALEAELAKVASLPDASELTARAPSELKIAADEAVAATNEARRNEIALAEQRNALRARRPQIGPELAAARAALSAVRSRQTEIRIASETRPGTRTSLPRALAEEQALLAKIELLEEQREGLDVRERLISGRIELAKRSAAAASARADRLREAYERRQRAELLGTEGSASARLLAHDPRAPELVEANAALLAAHPPERVANELAEARAHLASIEIELADIEAEAEYTKRALDSVGRSFAAGQVIIDAVRDLPETDGHELALRDRKKLIERAQLEVIGLSRQRMQLEREQEAMGAAAVAATGPIPEPDTAATAMRNLREGRLELLNTTIGNLEEYIGILDETQTRERALVTRIDGYRSTLRSRQGWVPNLEPVGVADLRGAVRGFATVAHPDLWRGGVTAFGRWLREQPLLVGSALIGMMLALGLAWRVGVAVPALAQRVNSASLPSRIVYAAMPALFAAAAFASGLWLAGWLVSSAPDAPPGASALGSALLRVFGAVLLASAVLLLYAPRGPVLQCRPDLSEAAADLRRTFGWIGPALGLLVLSVILFEAHVSGIGAYGERAARLCLILAVAAIAWAMYTGLRSKGRRSDSIARPMQLDRPLWIRGVHLGALFVPLFLCAAVLGGYVLGTFLATRAVLGSLAVIAIYVAVREILLARSTEASKQPAAPAEEQVLARDHVVKLALLVLLAIALWRIWADVQDALGYLRELPLWTSETGAGIEAVTVADLLGFLLLLGGTLLAFWSMPILAGTKSIDTSRAGIGTRYAAITLLRYGVLIVGLFVAFSRLNVGWSKLQWMAAGLSVGLGFGLQESVANFVAGLMLLTEGQVRVGDLVTVGDKTGIVSRIQMRATTVKDFDGREIIIPNKELVTTQVTNWTLSDTNRRIQLVVGVAYGSDPEKVERLMLEAVQSVPWVMSYPAPRVVFEQFGADALQFRLYVWIDSGQLVLDTIDGLHRSVARVFREHGVEIAFPQRDVHLDATVPLPVRVVETATNGKE